MPEFHAEPYVYLAGLTHKAALVAWGAFYFRVRSSGSWKLVDDDELKYVHPPRCDTIGAKSKSYGPARVDIYDEAGVLVASNETMHCNHCWVAGLLPDTTYTYTVTVKGEAWAQGQRWDWASGAQRLEPAGQYQHRFRTFPDPERPSPPITFAVIGDFGVGVRRDSPTRCQRTVAEALRVCAEREDIRFVLTTGDNIYAGRRFLGIAVGDTGDEDDDWFFTFFQPYRYLLDRMPVYPCIGNHDSHETEDHDDRDQVTDNFYLTERFAGEAVSGRASLGPGLFYRFRVGADIELVSIDTSKENFFRFARLFEHPNHWPFLQTALPPAHAAAPRWLIPFCHHPPYCAGPQHHNTDRMERLVALFREGGVRTVFSGHEHNFQHSRVDGIDYLVTGAAGKLRRSAPDGFAAAGTQSWAAACHFLLVTIDGSEMRVRAVGGVSDADPEPRDIDRFDAHHAPVHGPIVIRL